MYPPKYHLETNQEKIYQVIEAFPLASLISQTEDDLLITHIPLVLDRASETLIGHMDKNNPHCAYLDQQKVTLVFTGPDTYISPRTYASSKLPTWNYISVHVKGNCKIIHEFAEVSESIIAMAEFLEPENSSYQLTKDDNNLQTLVPYVTGFEISIKEMIGRYKLSQDKSDQDKELAKQHLIKSNMKDHSALLDYLLDNK